ncbi:hypothetical protein LCGC14_1409660 [marine sediment metagenome]|uniref:Uncharacterized protein n=1 Tax=marine sediment metagenome TaxID=412755 RepID=A0A0F9JUY0_9ZZZZ
MSFDNRQFNVVGQGLEMLERTLVLAFEQHGSYSNPAAAYRMTPQGMVIDWTMHGDAIPFPCGLSAADAARLVWSWLELQPTWKEFSFPGWTEDNHHDGHNSKGWRVFCEDWGHVGGNHYSIVAIAPAYLWHGK